MKLLLNTIWVIFLAFSCNGGADQKLIDISEKENIIVKTITVAKDGSGDYTEIQEAINSTKTLPADRIEIMIGKGTYYEKIVVPNWASDISFIGADKAETILTYDDYSGKPGDVEIGTSTSYSVLVEGNDFYATNLTIQNTSGEVAQAVALSISGDRAKLTNCNILGDQDTFFARSNDAKIYMKDCHIEGTTDFIFGGSTVFLENCTILSKKNSYITAASTPEENSFGFVFKNCTLTANENTEQVYLGRPWRNFAQTVFLNCEMGAHIRPEGWHNWSKPEAESTAYYGEYNCSGPGFKPESRVSWAKILTKMEAEKYTLSTVLHDDKKDEWYNRFE